MAKKKKGSRIPGFLRHQRLMAAEALLLAAFAEQWLQEWAMEQAIPRWSKVLLAMGLVLGLFGVFLGVFKRTSRTGLATVHGISSKVLVPHLVVHGVVFAGLFYLYAKLLNLWPVA